MAQYQEESFVIPSNTFLPGYFSSMFESELTSESILGQHLAQEPGSGNGYLPEFQCGPSFDGENSNTTELYSSYPPPSTSSTNNSSLHPATEEEIQFFHPWYPSFPYTEEELLAQDNLQTSTHASPPTHTESGWDTWPQDSSSTTRAPIFRGDYPSSFMEALAFPATNENLGLTQVSPGNQHENNYQTFSNTFGEGLGNNPTSTGEQQTVEDPCSGYHPVEHDHSERNAHGSSVFQSGLYGQNNASEWLPGAYESIEEEVPHTYAGTWTDESIAPEQPTPSTSQVQGHVPSCMGGLGVSVTRERKRRKDKGFRFVNLASS
uniref:Uncharacterized protein n=1 Tax=Psilocybe cubensis TaxID=181762 RepID=A0A8H7XRC7_PSICU